MPPSGCVIVEEDLEQPDAPEGLHQTADPGTPWVWPWKSRRKSQRETCQRCSANVGDEFGQIDEEDYWKKRR